MDLHLGWAAAGAIAAAVGGGAGLVAGHLSPPLRAFGPTWIAVAVALVLVERDAATPVLLPATVLLAAGEALAARSAGDREPQRWIGFALLLAGWVLTAPAPQPATTAARAVIVLPAIGAGLAACSSRWPTWTLSIVIAGATAATWLCVPDTEAAVLLGGAACAIAAWCVIVAASHHRSRTSGELVGWWAVAAVWLVGIGAGAAGRPAAAIGAIASAGVVVLWPLGLTLGRIRPAPTLARWSVVIIGVSAALGLWSSRVAGLTDDATTAAGLSIAGLAAAAAVLAVSPTALPSGADDRDRPGGPAPPPP